MTQASPKLLDRGKLGAGALYFLGKHYLTTGFGVNTVINGFNEVPPLQQLRGVPENVARQMRAILLARGLGQSNTIFRDELKRLSDELYRAIARNNEPAQETPIPTVQWDSLDPDEFHRTYVQQNRPVVIRGFGCRANEWSIEWFANNYGDVPVIMTDWDTGDDFERPIKDLEKPAPSGGKAYIHNTARLWAANPELLKDLETERLNPFIQTQRSVTQLFLGNRPNTGAPFHCANVFNVFYMLEGRKHWTFVDPAFTLLLYPWITPHGGYQASLVGFPDGRFVDQMYPLYRYCPRYSMTLEPGDLLLNPPWWWHAVRNVTAKTTGVATRWFRSEAITNRLFEFLNGHGLSWKVMIPQVVGLKEWKDLEQIFEEGAHGDKNYFTGEYPPADVLDCWRLRPPEAVEAE